MWELNILRSRWSWSLLSSSLKTFSNVWGWESMASHMARAALQAQSALSSRAALATALCPGQPRRAQAVPQPCSFPTPRLQCLGPVLGKQEGPEVVFPVGQGGTRWRGSGLAGPALATAGLGHPAGLESVVGCRALLLRAVRQFSVGLTARKSPGPSSHMEQAHGSCWGFSTCHTMERASTGS